MNLHELRPDPHNRRKHNPRNLEMLAEALRTVGAARSIVIDETGEILAGNGVVEAASAAGLSRVQVVDADGETVVAVRRSGLTAEQKRALAIYDNRTAELAEWNFEQLAADQAAGMSLQPFWTTDEEAALFPKASKAGKTDPDAVPNERPTDIQSGDLFELGRHRLLCGDSTNAADVARVMGAQRADIVITSPPYNVGAKSSMPNRRKYLHDLDERTDDEYCRLLVAATELALNYGDFIFVNIQSVTGNKLALIRVLIANEFLLCRYAHLGQTNSRTCDATECPQFPLRICASRKRIGALGPFHSAAHWTMCYRLAHGETKKQQFIAQVFPLRLHIGSSGIFHAQQPICMSHLAVLAQCL
jgi:hypothetical protein